VRSKLRPLLACCAALLAGAATAQTAAPPGVGPAAGGDYPTAAVADYVYGCLKANGETRTVLERCSCSIDVLASLLPYADYEEASTFLSLAQVQGERSALFRETGPAKAAVDRLRRAQAEAEVRCF